MTKEEARKAFVFDGKPLTEEMAWALGLMPGTHPSYFGAIKEQIEDYLGLDDCLDMSKLGLGQR